MAARTGPGAITQGSGALIGVVVVLRPAAPAAPQVLAAHLARLSVGAHVLLVQGLRRVVTQLACRSNERHFVAAAEGPGETKAGGRGRGS